MEKVRNYTRVPQCIPPTNRWSNGSCKPLFGKWVEEYCRGKEIEIISRYPKLNSLITVREIGLLGSPHFRSCMAGHLTLCSILCLYLPGPH